jgi:hypothetical protein
MEDNYDVYDDYHDVYDDAELLEIERELNRGPRCTYNRVDPTLTMTDAVFKSHFR